MQLAIWIAILSAWGAKPPWLTKAPPDDGTFRYYVGRASRVKGEADAYRLATQDAMGTAIRENFGTRTRIQTQSSEIGGTRRSDQLLSKNTSEESQEVEIRGFELVDAYPEELENHALNLWLLFRYRKDAIENERTRLSHQKASTSPTFSEVGKNAAQGVLEVTTDPPGASVFVDGESFGKAPLRILGQIAPGIHTVQVQHPSFESREEKVMLNPGGKAVVELKLRQAMGQLRIVTEPPNAVVLLNGKWAGNSPLGPVSIPAEVPTDIEITHPEAEKIAQQITLQKEEERTFRKELPLKPGTLSLLTEPSGAHIEVYSGNQLVLSRESPVQKASLPAGTYRLLIRKAEFQDRSDTFVLHGGENRVYPIQKLQRGTSGSPGGSPAALARKWIQYAYRGFGEYQGSAPCIARKKEMVENLKGLRGTSTYETLRRYGDNEKVSLEGEAQSILQEITRLEAECSK